MGSDETMISDRNQKRARKLSFRAGGSVQSDLGAEDRDAPPSPSARSRAAPSFAASVRRSAEGGNPSDRATGMGRSAAPARRGYRRRGLLDPKTSGRLPLDRGVLARRSATPNPNLRRGPLEEVRMPGRLGGTIRSESYRTPKWRGRRQPEEFPRAPVASKTSLTMIVRNEEKNDHANLSTARCRFDEIIAATTTPSLPTAKSMAAREPLSTGEWRPNSGSH
jgi:hypothetical protein